MEELGLPRVNLSPHPRIFITLLLLITCELSLSVYPTLANLHIFLHPTIPFSPHSVFCCLYLTLSIALSRANPWLCSRSLYYIKHVL